MEDETLDLSETKGAEKITILIADDHPLMRQSLKSIISDEPDLELIGEATDGDEAVKLAVDLEPDVVIMDIGMPRMNGLEATERIKSLKPKIIILVLTIHNDDQSILSILHAGAAGYLIKNVFAKQIVQSIRAVVEGEMILSPDIGRKILKHAARFPTKPIKLSEKERLSERELEILKLASYGWSNSKIATDVGISVRTVKAILANIFLKLGSASRTEAVITALRLKLISIDDP